MYRSPRDEFKELFAELDRAVASYPIGSHKAVDPLRKIVGACLRSEEPHDEWARAAHDAVTKIAENVVTLLGLGHAVAALGDICVRSGPGERHDPPGELEVRKHAAREWWTCSQSIPMQLDSSSNEP